MDPDVDQDQGYTQSLAGAMIVASFFNWVLLGMLALQVYSYYLAFPRDRPFIKILVYAVFILELVQTGVILHDVYVALGSSFGSTVGVDAIQNFWWSIPVSGGISGGIGQFFFAYRIWKMTNGASKGPMVIGTLALASVISALVSARAFFHARNFSTLLTNNNNSGSLASIGVWNGIGAICDISIALAMPYYIMRHGTGMPSTHIMIVKLVRLIIETGGLTAIVAILHLCLYFANSPSFIVPGLTVSKLYANTMLVILNNRMQIVDGRIPTLSENLEVPESPNRRLFGDSGEGRSRNRSKSTITVSNERLIFRLDDRQAGNIDIEKTASHGGSSSEEMGGSSVIKPKTIHFGLPPALQPVNSKL